ncbi:putative biotin--protein ligase 2 [Cocos nucifera]|nr:putative biotin--protein ligase 2 [Cocos nucifera]
MPFSPPIPAAAAAFRSLRLRLSPPSNLPIPPPSLLSHSTKPISTTRLSSSSGGTMDGHRPSTLLLLAGKSSEENDLAQSLKSKSGTLNLGDEEQEEIKILLQSEMDSITPPTFSSQLYMDVLSTSRFGRLLIWSPRLPSTHDLVSQCEKSLLSFKFSFSLPFFE